MQGFQFESHIGEFRQWNVLDKQHRLYLIGRASSSLFEAQHLARSLRKEFRPCYPDRSGHIAIASVRDVDLPRRAGFSAPIEAAVHCKSENWDLRIALSA
ncbi:MULTISPECIES: hypothetical protein [unclassified Caballeronia]|uniref:hypothetical protein n=1 Tax=unclassified Caballeronia TaxID=2646786 RepID=UPI00285F37E2|nr:MULTISPECIES: hypothetical protein [unclassified Caballeronia]MDR5755057.1 hypothetical protein [Caballeronia sp. LZ024]MDR5845149.1 hypothetical protein [Caballeronia sp. LZ031]